MRIFSRCRTPLRGATTPCRPQRFWGLISYRCYVAAVSPSTYWREELFKIHHNLTQKLRLSFRYTTTPDTTVLTPQWNYLSVTNPAAETFPTIQNSFVGPGISLVARVTDTITSTFINTFVLAT